MAKIVIAGDAVVVTSAMKLEDIKTIEKYRPKELVLKGGEDGVSAALFEADGNAWKNAAIRNIKAYFEREIPQELRDDVIILA